MPLCRASVILPCHRLDDFPSHLAGDRAAELLAAWTGLWHPLLIDAIGTIPTWRPSDDLPDPIEFQGELLVRPETSRLRMSADWADRMRATNSVNPPPVDAAPCRAETIAAILTATGLDQKSVRPEFVGDFLALGHAHLQVELLTRAMHYSTVLDTEMFSEATVAAARAAIAGDEHNMREELARAFDLLADARNHVYAVDFFVIDLTLLAPTTLGEPLRAKLASGSPTSLLAHGELLDALAANHPETLAELQRALDAGTACLVGGTYHEQVARCASPEAWLREIDLAQAASQRHMHRDYEIFGTFRSCYSPLLPELLTGTGFTGALHTAFDGSRLPRSEQVKTWWGRHEGHSIATLTAKPLDASLPETWLKLAGKICDTIAHDHVATILLASWPSTSIEYYDDLKAAARYGPVLGKLVTLDEYFRVSRDADDWIRFHSREYPTPAGTDLGANPISSQTDAYRNDTLKTYERLNSGLNAMVGATPAAETNTSDALLFTNAWNFSTTSFIAADPLDFIPPSSTASTSGTIQPSPCCIPEIPGWGFATRAAAAPAATVPLAEGRMLRNERIEVAISETTGGIQSLRTYRDRGTRLSQRLVYHRGRIASSQDSQMVADSVQITSNDPLFGQIESQGRILDPSGNLLANFQQCVRVARGISAVFVDVELTPENPPDGDLWRCYFASRLAWADDAIAVRRGSHWMSLETGRERIESPEWVEIVDGFGTITCFSLGLPYHRRASPNWLDTILIAEGEQRHRFQFALAIDENYPARTALALLTSGQSSAVTMPAPPPISRGWFLHLGAKNVVVTHLDRLPAPRNGIRVRLLETEGRETQTSLTAFQPFTSANTTDFRGNPTGVLSILDGRAEFRIPAHSFLQIEAEW